MSYKRINHPSEMVNIGDKVTVQIVRINRETQRISLGMKQLETDPWEGASAKYPVDAKFTGRVTNITDYGAFVELESGIEGLVHVSEMSWTKKNVHPGQIVSTSEQVEVVILEVDEDKRRISLGLKQAQDNPWSTFADKFPVGAEVEGEVKNATEFGLFVGLDGDVDGMVHMSDIAWGLSGEEALSLHHKGETVKAVVLDIDSEKERISLGMKQLERGGVQKNEGDLRKGKVSTVTVLEVKSGGLDVQAEDDGPVGFVKRSDLGRDRDEQRPDRFQVGQKFDAMVVGFDRSKKPNFSIKALQAAEEKQAVEQYGSTDSGASLGDILGAALKQKDGGDDANEEPKAAKATEAKDEPEAEAKDEPEAEAKDETEGQGRSRNRGKTQSQSQTQNQGQGETRGQEKARRQEEGGERREGRFRGRLGRRRRRQRRQVAANAVLNRGMIRHFWRSQVPIMRRFPRFIEKTGEKNRHLRVQKSLAGLG